MIPEDNENKKFDEQNTSTTGSPAGSEQNGQNDQQGQNGQNDRYSQNGQNDRYGQNGQYGGQNSQYGQYGQYGGQNRLYGNQYYSTPRSNYGGPQNNYGGPQSNYGGPRGSYGGPQNNYGGPQNYGQPYYAPGSGAAAANDRSRIPGWGKALIIILCIVLALALVFYGIASSLGSFTKNLSETLSESQNDYETFSFNHDYVGVLYLTGTISDGRSGDGYNQSWMLDCIDQMMTDDHNKGILLFANTPGGSAFATYDVYHALLDYKDTTGRPIYVYMDSQATSGGYYVSMAGDKIYAHPECWTGSIGVIVGTLYDFSGLFEKYGIKAYSITSGENKDIGANYKPMTDEQKEILQSLVDESFGRFVQAVCDGRNMDEATVRKLADGRIYSAQQAAENGLIDEVGTLSDAWADMSDTYGFGSSVTPENIYYEEPETLRDYLGFSSDINGSEETNELRELIDLLYDQNSVKIEFIAPVQK